MYTSYVSDKVYLVAIFINIATIGKQTRHMHVSTIYGVAITIAE